eukprot:CAMPEP_0206137548 /NCGR_PEP_ID=MMETSP1473-20131121/2652_1 /ASSEMBLY_ACC=CAM_ASM_001109 /TAXON_ID=1461547 /ORGANISM="Stichococcus sp, Strain RCC1054" /LENGTH=516 /DNA_ID=CAMNT_0053530689 /DNA_START=1652 /DNA_END=3202 /DNA_ORIENTATION=-
MSHLAQLPAPTNVIAIGSAELRHTALLKAPRKHARYSPQQGATSFRRCSKQDHVRPALAFHGRGGCSSSSACHALPPAIAAAGADEAELVRRHVLSVFVRDEPGLINQVSAIFDQAGLNIDSLAVGLNVDTALFTITVTCTQSLAEQMLDRVVALPKVLYVESLTDQNRVERELVLIKVRAPNGAARQEVTQLARIYGASMLDASDDFVTLAATGGASKTEALQLNLAKHGVVQLCRTGQVSLKRGGQLLDVTASMTRSMDDLEEVGGPAFATQHNGNGAQSAPASNGALPFSSPSSSGSGTVGISQEAADAINALQSPSTELWQAKQALSEDGTVLGVLDDSHTLSIEVADRPGTLTHVTAAIATANVNVQSLAVGGSEIEGRSRITMVIPRDEEGLPQLISLISALPEVGNIRDLTDLPFVSRELMIVKVRSLPSQRGAVKDIAEIFHGKVIDVSPRTMTLELQGREEKMIAAQGLLKEFSILEVARTGRVALPRDSGINTKLLEKSRGKQVMI